MVGVERLGTYMADIFEWAGIIQPHFSAPTLRRTEGKESQKCVLLNHLIQDLFFLVL